MNENLRVILSETITISSRQHIQ